MENIINFKDVQFCLRICTDAPHANEKCAEIFKQLDKDSVGKLTKSQAQPIWTLLLTQLESNDPRALEQFDCEFEKFDEDKDGFFNNEEFKGFMLETIGRAMMFHHQKGKI